MSNLVARMLGTTPRAGASGRRRLPLCCSGVVVAGMLLSIVTLSVLATHSRRADLVQGRALTRLQSKLSQVAAADGGMAFAATHPRSSTNTAVVVESEPPKADVPSNMTVIHKAMQALVKNACADVFAEVDHDNSGTIDSAEFHVAVLLVFIRLNRILGDMSLDPPSTNSVKKMLADRGTGDAPLTLDEFEDVFCKRFFRSLAARVSARLVTHRLLIPLTAVGLNLAASHMHLAGRLETLVTEAGDASGIQGRVAKKMRRAISHRLLPPLCATAGHMVNLCVAKDLANRLQIEARLEKVFRRSR